MRPGAPACPGGVHVGGPLPDPRGQTLPGAQLLDTGCSVCAACHVLLPWDSGHSHFCSNVDGESPLARKGPSSGQSSEPTHGIAKQPRRLSKLW